MFWLTVSGFVIQVLLQIWGAEVVGKEIADAGIYVLVGWTPACAIGSVAVRRAVLKERQSNIAVLESIRDSFSRIEQGDAEP